MDVLYDAITSEHLGRPAMMRLRSELIAGRKISGVIIPTLGRLSMDDHHRQTFEKECQYYGARFVYGDAPSGTDIGSMFARTGLSLSNYLRVKTNWDSALAGNIGRVLAGKVPAHKATYGYRYCAEKTIEPRSGRARVLRAWWELDELGPDGELLVGSPAWAVRQIFTWVGDEGRTGYWAITRLNEVGVPPLYGATWAPRMVGELLRRKSYTGKAEYNANQRVPNPSRPLGDPTLEIRRTLVRRKPEGEKVTFDVPRIVTEGVWWRANRAIADRGRGRGKQGKRIQALLRGRVLCPICHRPMAVLRRKNGRVYYYCRAHYRAWAKDPCPYNTFVPATWDDEIWSEICHLLEDDAWVERQMAVELRKNESVDRLIRLQQLRI